jgi:CheY-like chemotaxis protein
VRSRAFEPFFTTKEPGKGTGLGLSIVYGFAKQTGGTVTIDSEIGKGTTVRIYLPRVQDWLAAPGAEPDRIETDPGPPSRVLVVDDDRYVRTAISALVRTFGHAVIEAESGQAALDYLEHDRSFDLLIVDLAMPVIHGSELADKVRRYIPSVQILFVTGDANASADHKISEAHVLKKPFRQSDLVQKLSALLGCG